MKISLITVTFNSEITIKDTLESVKNQSYHNIEHIIIDGGSKDNTLFIVEKYPHIQKIISEIDNGIYDAMNKGIEIATGEVIGFINSDDLFQDIDTIALIMKHFNSDRELDILYGNLVYVNKYNTKEVIRNWISKPYYKKYFEYGNVPPHPTLYLRSRVYKIIGLFNLDFEIASDYDLMLRMFKKYTFKSFFFDKLLIRMRQGGKSNKNFKNILKQNI